jgi:hypothetical protein
MGVTTSTANAGQTYIPIQSTTLTTGSTSVSFSSFSGYTDLKLVYSGTPSAGAQTSLRFNSDSASNYSDTYIYGDGTTAASGRNANTTVGYCGYIGASGNYAVLTVEIFNISNSTSYKTYISRGSFSGAEVGSHCGQWRGTGAITTITFATNGANFNTGSTFTLYGIKAA